MKRYFKCKFCHGLYEFRSQLFEHSKLAHEDDIMEEVFFDSSYTPNPKKENKEE